MSAVMTPTTTTPPPAAAAVPKPWRWSRDEYHRLGEHGFFRGKRVELVRGEIIAMSPVGEPHVRGVVLAMEALRAVLPPGHYIRPQMPLDFGADGEPEPDLALVAGTLRDPVVMPTTAALVVEVSDTSLHYDTTTKVELYAAANVPEYWVVDLVNRRLLVFRDPAAVSAGGTTYRTLLTYHAADTVSPLAAPATAVRVADLLP